MKFPCYAIANPTIEGSFRQYDGLEPGKEYYLIENSLAPIRYIQVGDILVRNADGSYLGDFVNIEVPFWVYRKNIERYFTVSHRKFNDKLDSLLEE